MSAMAHSPDLREPLLILVAEDSKYDRLILQEVFAALGCNVALRFVVDGEEVLDYLLRRNGYAAPSAAPRPALILMDLNMPRMTGTEALRQIRANNSLCTLPVIVLSTADNPKLIVQAYATGINAFMTKPASFDDFVALFRKFGAFWFEAAVLPVTGVVA